MFDDKSSDGTADVVVSCAREDERVTLVGSERVGLVEALCRLIQCSNAEFLARMDADDISHPERLAAQVAMLEAFPDLAGVGCRVRHFSRCVGRIPISGDNELSREGVPGGMRRYETWLNRLVTSSQIARDLLVESPLCHPSVTLRRSAYEATEGYRDDGRPEDYGLWLALAAKGMKLAKVNRELFYWRDQADRLSRTHPRYAPARFLELKLAYLLNTRLQDRNETVIWGAGKNGRRWSRALGAEGVRVTGFIDVDPAKIGHRIHGSPVTPPPESPSALRETFLLVAVGSSSARERIRAHLNQIGLTELTDFVCVA